MVILAPRSENRYDRQSRYRRQGLPNLNGRAGGRASRGRQSPEVDALRGLTSPARLSLTLASDQRRLVWAVFGPRRIQSRTEDFSFAESLRGPGGMRSVSIASHSGLFSSEPNVTAGPLSPPLSMACSDRTSRPPRFLPLPWQEAHLAAKIGRTSLSKAMALPVA